MNRFFKSLLVSASILLLVSCGTDDDDNNNSTQVEGTWKLTAWNSSTPLDLNEDGTASTNLLDEVNCLNDETIVFSGENMATVFSTSYLDIEITLEIGTTDSYEFDVDCELEEDTFNLTYTRTVNSIILTEDGDAEGLVGSISGNQLSFQLTEEFEIYDENFNVVDTVDLTIVYTKQ